MHSEELLSKIKNAPLFPGCYIYKDSKGEVIYVGKAKSLKRRVNQYFTDTYKLDRKYRIMVAKIVDVEFVTTETEIDALVLEANLIKKYMPHYNKLMKDDKRYVWVAIDRSKKYPPIFFTRDEKQRASVDYFGPFPSKYVVFNLLRRLRSIFQYCERPLNTDVEDKSKLKPCFYYHIGLCNGACIGEIEPEMYRKNINKIAQILRGDSKKIIEELQEEMLQMAADKKFEEAAVLRDKIREYNYIRQQKFITYGMDEQRAKLLKEIIIDKSLKSFITKLKIENLEPKDNFKIECYDISNIQGKNAVGSMIVFVNGRKVPRFYRKFKIKVKDTPDDFTMMKELLGRRLDNLKDRDESFGIKPDLIMIDGGKGQLSAAYHILQSKEPDIPVISLAKREEEIFMPKINDLGDIDFRRIKFRDGSDELFLIQRIRDEAHRFAITYHRTLRSKAAIVTTLDSIPGIGMKTKTKLLTKYGSWNAIKKAPKAEIAKLVNKTVLQEILKRR